MDGKIRRTEGLKSVELFRIDDLLVHGQVVVGWGQPLDIQLIVLVDDELAGSEWEQEIYRMGAPPEMTVLFETVDGAATALESYRQDPRNAIILTSDVDTMRRLVEAAGVPTVNLGGIHHAPGRTKRLHYIFLTPGEESALMAMAERGVEVTAQDVPAARAVPLHELLANEESR